MRRLRSSKIEQAIDEQKIKVEHEGQSQMRDEENNVVG